jgi:hypothetical protein
MEWPSEEMAKDLARYVDAYNEEPDLIASFSTMEHVIRLERVEKQADY